MKPGGGVALAIRRRFASSILRGKCSRQGGTTTGRIHPNPDVASRQHKTRRWWATAKSDCRLFISQLLLDECGAGDPTAAQERIEEIDKLPRLDITDDVRDLANALMAGGAIPRSEPRDALHVAIAAVINDVIRDNGYEPPIICTPEELAGMTDDPNDTD